VKALLVALLLLGASSGVARLQPRLAATLHATKSREDVYVLPPPSQLKVMDLGYHAATVDMLWAKLLVEYGIHHQEKRAFPDLEKYMDAILGLEPRYAPLYRYGASMIVYRPPRGYEPDARRARALLERGIRERPDDWRVWQEYGDFLAFVAPSFLGNEEEIAVWRGEGAEALMRALSLGGDAKRAMSAAAILGKRGERDAQIRQLEKTYAMTDDEDDKQRIAAQLAALQDNRESDHKLETVERHRRGIERECGNAAPFLPKRDLCVLVGPFPAPAACAGPAQADAPGCARTWGDLFAAEDARYTPSQ